jgi:predicted component of type VI protein secretion system
VKLAMINSSDFSPSLSPRSSRFLGFFSSFRNSKAAQSTEQRMHVSEAKLKFELKIQDMQGKDADRLRYKIRGVRDVRELWLLRSDVHELISKRQNQQAAADAINDLLPCFEGWIPAHQLAKI